MKKGLKFCPFTQLSFMALFKTYYKGEAQPNIAMIFFSITDYLLIIV